MVTWLSRCHTSACSWLIWDWRRRWRTPEKGECSLLARCVFLFGFLMFCFVVLFYQLLLGFVYLRVFVRLCAREEAERRCQLASWQKLKSPAYNILRDIIGVRFKGNNRMFLVSLNLWRWRSVVLYCLVISNWSRGPVCQRCLDLLQPRRQICFHLYTKTPQINLFRKKEFIILLLVTYFLTFRLKEMSCSLRYFLFRGFDQKIKSD